MGIFLQHISSLLIITHLHVVIIALAAMIILYVLDKRKTRVYLLDFSCYRAPDFCRVPIAMLTEHIFLDDRFDRDSATFQMRILENSGFSNQTCAPPSLFQVPIRKSLENAKDEALTVIFAVVADLLEKKNINPKDIDILICNCCVFFPTPSLAARIVSKFGMKSNIMSFNLSGMGCSAGIIAIGLARDLLRVHRRSLSLVVSVEVLNLNWYTGKVRSMLLPQCLFRMGGAAILMSSQDEDRKVAKYELQHVVRTTTAQDDQSYACIYQDLDSEDKTGISISKDIIKVAGEALKANVTSMGPLVLPLAEQFRYGLYLIGQKLRISGRGKIYVPDFKKAFEHFCIHAGGKAVVEAIQRNLRLTGEDVEASKMTLYRFGNTSSSSIWYELSYIEAKRRIRRGDRVWQVAFGSGFKCSSSVWKCINNWEPGMATAWEDIINSYPVDAPS